MKLRRKNEETEKTQGQGTGESEAEVKAKTNKRKKQELEGSRWAAVVLLILTLMFGAWFYWEGRGGWKGWDWGRQGTWVYEKK